MADRKLNTKGPSVEAIRRFKEQQEQKKRDEEEKRIQDKLRIIEYRASHGDRRAKQVIKKIEQTQAEAKAHDQPKSSHSRLNGKNLSQQVPRPGQKHDSYARNVTPKLKKVVNFNDLMRQAKQNTNEVRREQEEIPKTRHIPAEPAREVIKSQSPTKQAQQISAKPRQPSMMKSLNQISNARSITTSKQVPPSLATRQPQPSRLPQTSRQSQPVQRQQIIRQAPVAAKAVSLSERIDLAKKLSNRPNNDSRFMGPRRVPRDNYDDEVDDYDEEEYEEDDFVVDDEDEEAQTELQKTLKSVFNYDKRRCDLREQEVERQYRAIGNVSTFEDLEREERRASRLAALEDARETQKEEERKRLKKERMRDAGRD